MISSTATNVEFNLSLFTGVKLIVEDVAKCRKLMIPQSSSSETKQKKCIETILQNRKFIHSRVSSKNLIHVGTFCTIIDKVSLQYKINQPANNLPQFV